MRVVIDATALQPRVGGLSTYVLGLLQGWQAAGFEDDVVLVTTKAAPVEVVAAGRDIGSVQVIDAPNPLARMAVQQIMLPRILKQQRADVLLAATPVLPALPLPAPAVAVVHDLRYLSRPDDFGGLRRRYRSLVYGLAYKRADRLIAISAATCDLLASARPEAAGKTSVVYHGADHVDSWPRPARERQAIAFAHWNNKRPESAITAWALMRRRLPDLDWRLHIVGAAPELAQTLAALSRGLAIDDLVEIHPFLSAGEFQELFARSRLLVFPSSEEGFGLPVIEAMRLGIPVVASDIAAFREIAGEHVLMAPPADDAALAEQCLQLVRDEGLWQQTSRAGIEWSQRFSWRRTAELTRRELVAAIDARRDLREPASAAATAEGGPLGV